MNTKQQDDRLMQATIEARHYVLALRPNAHIAYTVNKHGDTTHFAVYDCRLLLNENGNFHKEQSAPQRLGDLIPCSQPSISDTADKIHVDAWCSAADDLRRLNMRLSGVWLPYETR